MDDNRTEKEKNESLLAGTEFEPKGRAVFFRNDAYLPSRGALKRDGATEDKETKEIGWAEGVLSSGVMFRVECWAIDGITSLTYFIPAYSHRAATPEFFEELLEREGLLKFRDGKRYVAIGLIQDDRSTRIWSVNVVVGVEDDIYLDSDTTPLYPYDKSRSNRFVSEPE